MTLDTQLRLKLVTNKKNILRVIFNNSKLIDTRALRQLHLMVFAYAGNVWITLFTVMFHLSGLLEQFLLSLVITVP